MGGWVRERGRRRGKREKEGVTITILNIIL